MELDWRSAEWIDDVKDGEVILIQHNRGTWRHHDERRNNCVVVTRRGDKFSEFGPGDFSLREIAFWTHFDPPQQIY